jgi:hypothetical protein
VYEPLTVLTIVCLEGRRAVANGNFCWFKKHPQGGVAIESRFKTLKIHKFAVVSNIPSPFGGSLEGVVLCDLPKNHDRRSKVRPLERVEVRLLGGAATMVEKKFEHSYLGQLRTDGFAG